MKNNTLLFGLFIFSYFLSTEEGSTQRHLYRYDSNNRQLSNNTISGNRMTAWPVRGLDTAYITLFKLNTSNFITLKGPLFHSWSHSCVSAVVLRVFSVEPFQKECLSCSLFRSTCTFYDSTFSPDLQHVVLHCKGIISSQWCCCIHLLFFAFHLFHSLLGPGIPQTTLHKLSDMDSKS